MLTTIELHGRQFSPRECQLIHTLLSYIDDGNGNPVSEEDIVGIMLHQRSDLNVVHCRQLVTLLKKEGSPLVRDIGAAVALNVQWWSAQAYDQYHGFRVRRDLALVYVK